MRVRDTFPCFAVIALTGEKRKKKTAETVRESAIPNWLALFGAPGIMVASEDSRFIGKVPREFSTARNIVSQTVIPGHHQSLGETERRHGLFRTTIDHVVGNKKPNSLGRKEWGEFSAMATMRLNSQVLKFGGSAPRQRVSGRTPEMPFGAVGNPHFWDFTNPKEARAEKTHHLSGAIQKNTTIVVKC